jgi:hypothetical protein
VSIIANNNSKFLTRGIRWPIRIIIAGLLKWADNLMTCDNSGHSHGPFFDAFSHIQIAIVINSVDFYDNAVRPRLTELVVE